MTETKTEFTELPDDAATVITPAYTLDQLVEACANEVRIDAGDGYDIEMLVGECIQHNMPDSRTIFAILTNEEDDLEHLNADVAHKVVDEKQTCCISGVLIARFEEVMEERLRAVFAKEGLL